MELKHKKILKISLSVLAVLLLAYTVISFLGARKAMVIPRFPLTYPAESLGLPYENVAFKTRGDGLILKGWFLPAEGTKTIIMVHGGYQPRIDANADTPGLVRALVARGYNILLFDLRGRGESEGKGKTLSFIDEDIGGAVDYVLSRGIPIDDICLMGFSSGAVMSCIYGSRNEVGSLILDGVFIDGVTMLIRQTESINVPAWVAYFFMPLGVFFCRVLYDFVQIDPIDIIDKVECPVLFIQEENDAFTRLEETQQLLEASANPANEIWEAKGARHSQAFCLHPQEYVDAIDNFLKKTYLP